jgi:hypothetical protein
VDSGQERRSDSAARYAASSRAEDRAGNQEVRDVARHREARIEAPAEEEQVTTVSSSRLIAPNSTASTSENVGEPKDHPYHLRSRLFNSKNGARIDGREVEMSITSMANHTAPDDLGGTYGRGRVSRTASGLYGSQL